MTSIARFVVVVVLLLFVFPATLTADEKKKPSKEEVKEALELIQGANDDFENKDYKYALEGYEEAYAIYPNAIILYRLGLTHEKLENTREAVSFFRQYIEADPKGAKVSAAQKKIDKYGKDLPPIVELKSDPDGAEVYVDDPNSEAVATTPQLLEVEEGKYVFYIKKEGFRVFEVTKEVANGDSVVIEAKLEPLKGGNVKNDPDLLLDDEEEKSSGGGTRLSTWGWITVGAGAALLGTGAIFSMLSTQKAVEVNGYNKRSPDASRDELEDLKSSSNSFHSTSLGLFIGGGVLAATGLTLILLDSGSSESDTAWNIELIPSTHGAAVQLKTTF